MTDVVRNKISSILIKPIIIMALNILFLIFVFELKINHFIYLLLLYLTTATFSFIHLKNGKKFYLYMPFIIIILFLGIAKYEAFNAIEWFIPILDYIGKRSSDSGFVSVLGISYFSFRAIHFLIEINNKSIRTFSWLSLFNFLFFFPSFLSGPIDRYQSFLSNEMKLKIEIKNIEIGVERVLIGIIKKYGIGALFSLYSVTTLSSGDINSIPRFELFTIIVFSTMWLYFDFSGYTDIAKGTSKIIGIDLPENFNNPFIAKNIQDFWNRWHISLSTWIRDYLFFPIAKTLHKVIKNNNGSLIQAFAIMIAFMLSGIWHGDGANFLLWGAGHGFALGGLLLFRSLANKHFKSVYKSLKKNNIYLLACWLITFTFTNLMTVLFFCDLDKSLLIYSSLL